MLNSGPLIQFRCNEAWMHSNTILSSTFYPLASEIEIEPFSFSDEEFFSKNQPNETGLSKNIKQTGDCRGRQRFKVKCESERLNDRIESKHKSKRNEAT